MKLNVSTLQMLLKSKKS